MDDISFIYTTTFDPLAKPLIEDLIHEYDSRYHDVEGRDGAAVELHRYPPSDFAPPNGSFLLVLRNGETIGGGAFKRYDAITAELKRIWTRRDLRRQGLARRIVVELEAQALLQGYRQIYLTTGFRQPEAVGLYLSLGYTAQYDPNGDLAVIRKLPFTKVLTQVDAEGSGPPGPSASRAA